MEYKVLLVFFFIHRYCKGMKNETSDNKYSVRKDEIEKNYQLDWFEIGVWSDFEATDFLVSEIKNNLSCKLKETYGNSQYFQSLVNDDFGIRIFLDPRPKCHNHPLYLRLTGSFFRFGFSYSFVDGLLKMVYGLGIKWNPIRLDAAVDFIAFGQKYLPEPEPLARPGVQPVFRFEYIATFVPGSGFNQVLDSIKSGYGSDCALRVYNKLTDKADTEYLNRHPEYQGCSSVTRLEFQFRGDTLKAVFLNSPDSFYSYDSLYSCVLGQCFRRYGFKGFEFPASNVTSYRKRLKTDEGTYKHWQGRLKSLFHKVLQLEGQLFNKSDRGRSFEAFRVYDFLEEKEKLEGENNDS